MKTTIELIGDFEIIKDTNGNFYFLYELDRVTYWVLMNSPELTDIIGLALKQNNLNPSRQLINKVKNELTANTFDVKITRRVFFRYIKRSNSLFIHRGDENWMVKISSEKINLFQSKKAPICHSKYKEKLPFEMKSVGNFDLFWKYAPVKSEEHKLLILAWMINACFPNNNYPILLITGGAGSGKTFLTTMIKSLLDPTSFGISAPPKSIKDIELAAFHNYLLTFDNNGEFSSDIQNMLCQVSTGGKLPTRRLFTDTEVNITELRRPVITNGLCSPFSQDDVINRVLHMELRQLTNEDYAKTGGERNWKSKYKSDLPAILTGFYQLIQQIINEKDNVQAPDEMPRMYDFAIIGITLEKVLKTKKGAFLRAYKRNLKAGLMSIIEESELAQAVIKLAKGLDKPRTFKRTKLIEILKHHSDSPANLPKTPKELGGELLRTQKGLIEIEGIEIELLRRTRDGYQVKIIPSED